MLEELRTQIDNIDDELVKLIIERFSVAKAIAEIKMAEGLPVFDPAREREIIDRLTQGRTDVMAGYIKTLFAAMFDLSRSYQTNYLKTISDTAPEGHAAPEEPELEEKT